MTQLIALKRKSRLSVLGLFCLVPTFLQAQLTAGFFMDRSAGCSPLTVSFANQTIGASASAVYRWDFGNGNTSALKNPGAIFTDEKTYTVSLTVTDGGKTSAKTATITVYKKPVADFSVEAPKVCLPAAATFKSTSTAGDGSISSYYWDFGDGQTQQGYSSSMSHYYSSEQKPAVSLTVSNSYGCYSSVTKAGTLEILGRIDPVFSANKSLLCSLGDSVQFTNTSTGPGTLLYTWDFGDGTTSTQKTPSHVYTKKGVYQAKLTVSNTDGCSVTGWPVSVNAANFNTDFTTRNLCRELSFNSSSFLYANSSYWQFGDGSSFNTSSSATSHVYNAAGTYAVTLVNTYNTCKDTITKTVQVEDLVNYNSSIEVPATVCEKGSTYFKSKSTVDPGSSYWEFGDGGTFSPWKEAYHTYTTPGTYTIKLTNTFGTCKETVTRPILVNAIPNAKGFEVDYGGACGSPVTVKFKDTTAGAVKWDWHLDYPYINLPSTQNPSYSFTYDGTYSVWLTVTNAAGCSSMVSRSLSIYKPSVGISLQSSSSAKGSYDCDSLRIRLTTYSNQPLKDYLWNFGDGTTSTEAQPEHFYDKPASYSITLNYTTESGCKGTAFYSVRVYGKPKADFTYLIPCGNALNLQFNDISYFSDDWQWNFGDNSYNGYGSSPIHLYRDTGTYKVTFINHIGHCADTVTKEVYANVLPASVSITRSDNSCEGSRGTVTFDQQSLRIKGGTWNFGDGTTMPYDTSVHVIKHTYTKTGTYQVTLTGNAANCTLVSNRTVRILLKQNPVLTGNKSEICSNDDLNVNITNLETNPFSGNTQWGQYSVVRFEHDNGAVFNGYYSNYYNDWNYTNYASTLRSFLAGTTKMRVLISGYNGCTDTSNYINLKVNGPLAGFKVLTNSTCYKSMFEFQDTSRTSNNTALKTWSWDFGDGKTAAYTTGGNKVQHQYDNPGNYSVRLTVTDATGCVSTFSYSINVRGPKASFTASGLYVPNVPLNTTVNFYNNTISWYSNSVDYNWQYGDGASSAGYTGSHTYTQPGTNTVRLIANDPSIQCADTAYQTITVKDFNTAFSFSTFNVANSTCPPVTIRINNLSVGYTKLLWDFGDGTTTSDQSYPSHTYDKPGVYRIVLYTYGYNGLSGTYRDSVIVSQPSAGFTADVLQGCTSQQVTLQAAAINTSSYAWDFGDGTIQPGTTTSSTHTYLTPGLYLPRLIVKDAKGCTSSAALADTVIIDSLAIAIKGIPAQICDSANIFFNPDVKSVAAEQARQPLVYHWDFGTGKAGDTSNLKNPVFNFTKTGAYTVRFKVTSPFGCEKEVSETVVVHKKPKAAILGPLELCAGGMASFGGNSSQSPAEWAWVFGNGNTSASQNPQLQVYSAPATYGVRLIVKYDGCYDTTVQQLVVHPNPVASVSAGKTLVCLGEAVSLTATGGTGYAWKPAASLDNAASAMPLARPTQNTKYVVEVSNAFGCKKSDSIQLTVIQPFRLTMASETFLCKGSSVQLTATGATSYQWINTTTGLNNTQVGNPVATPAVNTSYTVVGTDAYNCFKDTASIRVVVQSLPTVSAGPDVEMLAAETHQLAATASADVVNWNWSPADYLSCTACPSPITTPRMPMDYVVTVKNQWGCAASDTVSIQLQCSDNFVYIPNSFTPNNDGKNDMFYIKGKGIGIIRSLIIYNRWGETVFEKKNFNIDDRAAAWDGKYKGIVVPVGAYVYFAEMECEAGQPIVRKGTVTVVY